MAMKVSRMIRRKRTLTFVFIFGDLVFEIRQLFGRHGYFDGNVLRVVTLLVVYQSTYMFVSLTTNVTNVWMRIGILLSLHCFELWRSEIKIKNGI